MLDLDAIRARNHGFLCTLGKCTAPAVALEPGEEWAYRCKEHASESATPGRALEAQQDIAALLSELDRLTAELAAAQAELSAARRGPVVEWYPTTVGEAARLGMFWLSVGPGGWTLRIRLPFGLGIGDLVESGPETGDAGKSAAEAAYRKAAGLP